tara:strand:- start:672 stop:1151 length:480 start_codon:yes stop_codon:yes gene_type:complete
LNIVKKNKFIILILIITLIGTVLRFQDFNNGFWWDEWTTLWFSNINFSFSDQEYWNYLSYEVHADTGSSEPTPKIVFFIMQCYFKIFGYSAENAKIFVLTSGILFCLFSYYLSYLVLNNKKFVTKKKYNTILYLDVLEHIKEDKSEVIKALASTKKMDT